MKKLIFALLFCIITAFTILQAVADILPNPEFTITTIDMPAGTEFSFTISATGEFVVDWGDGTVESINSTTTAPTPYSHTYESGGVYTIGMSGQATSYWMAAAITFSNNLNIAGLSGSLGAIFGTTNPTGLYNNPKFNSTFSGCANLKGNIPETLFSGVNEPPVPRMFYATFSDCSGLTGSIPENLFAGIVGAPADWMFQHTFSGCRGLTGSIPENLFAGITGRPAISMFGYTFFGCSGLTGAIPEKLFAGILGEPADGMFYLTFYNCKNLKGNIPENLFAGIKGKPADVMFADMFRGCSGLTGNIPEKLFAGIDGAPAYYMFHGTFRDCSGLTGSIPEKLFVGIKGAPASYMFGDTFQNCSGLTGYIPYGLFSGISGERAAYDFDYTFNYTGLAKSCPAGTYQATINTDPPFNSLDGHAICGKCPDGTVSPAGAVGIEQCVCPENTYMDNNAICSTCPMGLASPMGSKDSGSCGRKLHIGDEILYFRSSKKTTPSLNIDINNDGIADFFGNATLQHTTINSTSQRYLRIGEYYIYDDSIRLE